jgi:hypothetical protein
MAKLVSSLGELYEAIEKTGSGFHEARGFTSALWVALPDAPKGTIARLLEWNEKRCLEVDSVKKLLGDLGLFLLLGLGFAAGCFLLELLLGPEMESVIPTTEHRMWRDGGDVALFGIACLVGVLWLIRVWAFVLAYLSERRARRWFGEDP